MRKGWRYLIARCAAVITIAAIALGVVLACDGAPDSSPPDSRMPRPTVILTTAPLPTLPPGSTRVLAPIDSAEIIVRESFPPQYALHIRAGLPNGCAKPAGYDLKRDGSTFRVAVYNSMPSGNVACTQIYGTAELTIELGGDIISGQEYRVDVNSKALSFRAE